MRNNTFSIFVFYFILKAFLYGATHIFQQSLTPARRSPLRASSFMPCFNA